MSIDSDIIERGDPDEALDLEKARQVGEVLCKHYPNHPWIVSFQGRALIVRHAAISNAVVMQLGRDGFGFVLKHNNLPTSSSLAHNAMIAGGQMLEAFGLKRGPWDGSAPVVPKEWKRRQENFQ